jgi:diguanylate cyclase (GGDEF)-like protein
LIIGGLALVTTERDAPAHLRGLVAPRRWKLWTQRPSLIAYCALMTVTTVVSTVVVAIVVPVRPADLGIFAILAALGISQAELGRQVERARRRITGTSHINMTSVWLLPAALLLPPAAVALLVMALYWHLHFRSWYRLKQVPAFRTTTSICAAILTCYVARAAAGQDAREASHAGWAGVAAIAISIGTYFVVNALLVIPAHNRADGGIQEFIGGWADNLLELTTLCLGAVTAVVLATSPALAVLVVPTVFLLHRAVLIEQLESAARRDGKTGVWNTAGWHRLTQRELAKKTAEFGVLMVDLDHFKRINDTYGHLAGDAILKSVADAIIATVRRCDSVGRFGGEEFVVLLPGLPLDGARTVAERIRTAIARLEVVLPDRTVGGLSVSIGIAGYPASGTTIERLLQVADAAMYRAKADGRNRVAG